MTRSAFLFIIILCFWAAPILQAQNTISGTVTDAETGEAIIGVNIYLANTTIGTSSRQDGSYVLKTNQTGRYQLVFSFVGYQRKVQDVQIKNGSNLQVSEELKPQVVELNEVEVVSSNQAWQNDYDFFHKKFLGDSDFTDLSSIENPWVINFEDGENGQLIATAAKPLIVENRGLGYRLHIELVNFEWSQRGGGGSYLIYPRYETLTPQNEAEEKQWHINRAQYYYGSLRHFLKNLYTNRLNSEPFEVGRMSNIEPLTKGETLFELRQVRGIAAGKLGDYKGYRLVRETNITYNSPAFVTFGGDTTKVLINKNAQIEANTNSELFFVDRKGNLLDPTSVKLFGAWAKDRVAHALPDDYLPGN